MKSFIDSVTEYLIGKFDDLHDVEIIVPNNRTNSAILSSLRKNVQEICWAPKITQISSVFSRGSKICKAEDIVIVYELFKIYKSAFGNTEDENKELSFDDFYNFGDTLLNDFDEIDKYLVDPHKLFKNIAEEKEIDVEFASFENELIETLQKFWKNVSEETLLENKFKTLALWEAMPNIYDALKQVLYEKHIGYQGLIYRDFIENRISTTDFNSKNYIFVGFSALNECEKKLFRHIRNTCLQNGGECLFFWDADQYYIKNKEQEAGLFLRNNIKEFPLPENFGVSDTIKKIGESNKIEIIEVPTPIAQVKLVPELLNEFDKLDGKTAIVLGDEKLLIPLIYSLPTCNSTAGYNITMGYPLSFTASASFVQIIMKLAMHRSVNKSKSTVYMQRKDINDAIQHSFSRMVPKSHETISEISSTLIKSKIEYISIDVIKPQFAGNELLEHIFDYELMEKSFPEYVLNTCKYVYKHVLFLDSQKTERDFMYKIITLFTSFNNALRGEIAFSKDKMYYKLMQSMIKQSNLPFEGKSEEKMQILGFMETRSLDFDNIIMLSMNEGSFPKSSTRESLIPYSLRKAFNMPSIEYQDSIFAYYFYRLLQRSKNIKLLYHTEGKVSHAEKSRFITQIEYELGLYENPKDKDQALRFHKTKSYEIRPAQPIKMEVGKDEKTKEKIEQLLGCKPNKNGKLGGAYPNLINTYITCPMKFYFNYIEGLREPENIDKDTSAVDFGNLLHESCHYLYDNYIGKEIEKQDFKKIKDNIDNAIKYAVGKVFEMESKDNALIERAMSNVMISPLRRYIRRIVDLDEEYAPFTIIDLENTNIHQKENDDYRINYQIGDNKVVIKGIVDRIDKKRIFTDDAKNQYVIRVIDYKTSNIDVNKRTYDEQFWTPEDLHKKEAAQVLIYSEIFAQLYPKGHTICPCIISVSKPDDNLLIYKEQVEGKKYPNKVSITSYTNTTIPCASDENDINLREDVNTNLIRILTEIMDPDAKFTQTENEDNCSQCIYKKICNKQVLS